MPIYYPDELPKSGLTGVVGSPVTTVAEMEVDAGVSPSRERVGLVMSKLSIEYPPLTQTQYETFLNFFHEILYDGILPFYFVDPMTNETKVFKFVQGYNEVRISPDYLKISFDLAIPHSAAKI